MTPEDVAEQIIALFRQRGDDLYGGEQVSQTEHAVQCAMAADLADSGVTANAIAPGSVDTDILAASAKVYGLGSVSEFAQHHTDQRLIGPEEIAEAVTWLCSPGSSAVTGAVLAVDAGMTAT